MISLRSIAPTCAAVVLFAATVGIAQTASLQQRIESRYHLTKPTADRSDLVSIGDQLTLHKDHLFMCSAASALASNSVYKDGKIQQNLFNKSKFFTAAGGDSTVPTRSFVAGEKFYLTSVDMKDDGVQLWFLSDVMPDGNRYYSSLKFPFPKGSTPSSDQMLNTIAEVITVEAAPNSAPTPAPVATRTVAVGQTKDQVTAAFGQPTKIVKLANKEIYYFPDMKVIFVHDKVSDVE